MEHQWQAGLLAAAHLTEESAKCNESQVSFLRHCPVSETVGLLTNRCSESGMAPLGSSRSRGLFDIAVPA